MAETVESFTLRIAEEALTDLRQRLSATRWPEKETVAGWEQGVPLDHAAIVRLLAGSLRLASV